MEHNKAPGPDGFPIVFYQEYWHIIGLDLLDLFSEFYKGKLEPLSRASKKEEARIS